MSYRFVPMNKYFAQTIAEWHYGGAYAFYDFDQDPEDLAELLNPGCWEGRYFAVVDNSGDLVGFFCFEPAGDAVELGLGLKPCETGKGSGGAFVEAGLELARQRFHPKRFCLQVAAFNQRAIRVYEKLGFRIEKIFINHTDGGAYEFVSLARDEDV